MQLAQNEYLPFYRNYINKIKTVNLLKGLEDGLLNTTSFFESIPVDKLEYRYAEEKWTVK